MFRLSKYSSRISNLATNHSKAFLHKVGKIEDAKPSLKDADKVTCPKTPLSEGTINTVKSTAPILHQYGEALTKHFYKRMFAKNPEVSPFFNPANQFAGTQQKALAGAICAYAANIDNLEVLGKAVELIAQKHASLQIKPEQYPIVGENLLAAIRELLGQKATPEILQAWTEAYGFLADILMAREAEIYRENASMPGGWTGFKQFKVLRKEAESKIITSFYLAPTDGSTLPKFKPGQYITVRVPDAKGQTTMRNYSLSDKPGQDWFRISVKREIGAKAETPKGYVSNFLHNSIEVGSTLEIGSPCGEFFLDMTQNSDRRLVLLGAGVGITPIFSILSSALVATPHRPITLFQACLNEEVQAFKPAIDRLAKDHKNLQVYYRYTEPAINGTMREKNASTGIIDAPYIEEALQERDADYYFCGPHMFMVNIYQNLLRWGIPASQVNMEFFGPAQELTKPKPSM